MPELTSKSYEEAESVVEERAMTVEIEKLVAEFAETDEKPARVLERHGWETEETVAVGANKPRFDGVKNRIGLEHERREQMNVRSHLLWTEAALRKNVIDAAVFIIPAGNKASIDRTFRELNDEIFTRFFPITCPILLIQYD